MSNKTVCYLSMEFALEENFPIYAGGLGVLAGDLAFEAGEEKLNFHSFGLFYHRGFHAHLKKDEEDLSPEKFGFNLLEDNLGKPFNFSIQLGTKEIWVQVWIKKYQSATIYLFDTNLETNSKEDREITKYLYGPDNETMLSQQMILAFATAKLLKTVGIIPDVFHLNEGHTSFLILALALEHHKSNQSISLSDCLNFAKQQCVGTKHTILTGGGLHLDKDSLIKTIGPVLKDNNFDFNEFFALGTHETHPDKFSTTSFLLRFTRVGSAVSLAHAQAEKKLHSHSNLVPITNGINKSRWQSGNLNPSSNLNNLSGFEFWSLHLKNKTTMLDFLQTIAPHQLHPEVLTIIWARRFASYKRPELLFSNIEQLTRLTNLMPAVQFIIAGQTNPVDAEAQELASEIQNQIQKMQFGGRVIFLTEYSLTLAKKLVAGADVWLNTPVPGFEASGTSGMKAGINGALEFSTKDGWFEENDWTNFGWTLPEENIKEKLYEILEKEIIPLYYQVDGGKYPPGWVERMKKTISLIDQKYTTKRVLEDYYGKLYFPI